MPTDTIRKEADYDAALAEIDLMGDPARGTSEFERLDRQVDQVEAYEAEHYPMGTPTAEAVAEYEAEKRGIVLSPLDYALFAGIMAADAKPTELAVQEATEWRREVQSGKIVLKEGKHHADFR